MRVRILVADQSEANFYDLTHRGEALEYVGGIGDPLARLHDREIDSDRPGRVFDHAPSPPRRRGAIAHHGTRGERSPRKHEAEQFARRIGTLLEEAQRQGEFERLVVMAPPEFLGLIRATLPPAVRAAVLAEIAKNLVREPPDEVQMHLPREVFARFAAV